MTTGLDSQRKKGVGGGALVFGLEEACPGDEYIRAVGTAVAGGGRIDSSVYFVAEM